MATATLVSNGRIEEARNLQGELTRCTETLEAVRESIRARREPDDIRRKFRECQTAMLVVGRFLMLDRRFRPRLRSEIRNEALDMLRTGARPIEVQRKLGLDNLTVRRLRHRELGDRRNLNKVCKLGLEEVAEIRSTGRATTRRTLAEKFNVSMSLISKIRNGRGPYRREAAVSVSSVQQTTVAKRPGPSREATNELHLRFNAELLESLMEMAELAHSEIAPFVMELVEVQVANFRAKPVPADFLIKPDKTPVPDAAGNANSHHNKMSPADSTRIAAQHDSGVTIKQLSERWHVGESTIRRALAGAKKRALPAPEIVQKILYLNAQKYDEHDEFIGVQAIAETLHLPESVVSAVLSNHKPVTPSTTAIYGRPPRPCGWDRHYLSNGGTNGNQTQR